MSTGNDMQINLRNFQGQYNSSVLRHVDWTFFKRKLMTMEQNKVKENTLKL